MECYLVESENKHHFVTKRFDIDKGKKSHVHSLAGLLHIDYNIPRTVGYEELLRVGVKLGAADSLEQLFLQMLLLTNSSSIENSVARFTTSCRVILERALK